MSAEAPTPLAPEVRRQNLFQSLDMLVFGAETPFETKEGQNGTEVVVLKHGKEGITTIVHHDNLLKRGEAIGIQRVALGKNERNGDTQVVRHVQGAVFANGDILTAFDGFEKRGREQVVEMLFSMTEQGIKKDTLNQPATRTS